jgi:CarD family transcriptional regulator
MFQVGDNIVYPMHGAGVIAAIEEKEIHGEKQQYFVIKMPGNMQLMIPEMKMNQSRVRPVEDIKSLDGILGCFHLEETGPSLTWKQRYTVNIAKMKTGNMLEGAEVFRDLVRINKEKRLNTSERQMLHDARRMLISEVSLIKGLSDAQASDYLDIKLEHLG